MERQIIAFTAPLSKNFIARKMEDLIINEFPSIEWPLER